MKNVEQLRKIFVSLERYSPVEKIVYGLVGLILTTVAIAILGLIFKTNITITR